MWSITSVQCGLHVIDLVNDLCAGRSACNRPGQLPLGRAIFIGLLCMSIQIQIFLKKVLAEVISYNGGSITESKSKVYKFL